MFYLQVKEKTEGRSKLGQYSFAFLIAACASFSFSPTSLSAQEVGSYATVQSQSLNLRAGPSTGHRILRALSRNTVVSIIERQGSWARVYVQNTGGENIEGWLSASYLARSQNSYDNSYGNSYNDSYNNSYEYGPPRYDHRYQKPRNRGHRVRRPSHGPHTSYPPQSSYPRRQHISPLSVDLLRPDCSAPIFGNSGIRSCSASARVQLAARDKDPNRSDHVYIVCHGTLAYRTEHDSHTRYMSATQRGSIARNDHIGQSITVEFNVRPIREKIISGYIESFSCSQD